jgi:Zn-dependent M28 family amino/carboxypeptidase
MSYAAMRGTPLDRDGQPVPGPLTSTVSVELDLDRRSIRADNVVCVLPGTDASAADTAIALSAHYDHLGVVPGVPSGDSIYNGFSDNAAGVAALLAIAKALTSESAPPVRNSILFLFFVGEERGLLGSDFYAAHPTWPLTKIKALINIDAGAPPGRPGWRVVTSPPRANSDYYPFVREGVPGVFIVPGPDPYEGLSADSSTALRKRWDFYHHPSDEWSEAFPFVGLQRYAEYAYLLARALDRTPRSSLNR